MALVSVIVPAYNQSRYLGEAIESILRQTCSDFEAIIVDDGSTDDTESVARGFLGDPRIRYIYQENRGLSAARNTGLRAARGRLLAFLDSDDAFLPDKLAILAGELEIHPEIGLVAGQAIPIDEHGCRVGRIFNRCLPQEGANLLLGNPLHVGSVLLRREWQERVGEFDESLRSYEDWDLWLRLARAGCPMGWVPRPVSLYRFHSMQMTRDGGQMTAASFAVLSKVFGDPSLPESWRRLREQAYGQAHLRAAANCFLAKDYVSAKANLTRAVALDRHLLSDGGRVLADRFSAWADLPKTRDPIGLLESVYNNLPDELAPLRRHRREIGLVALRIAFEAYSSGARRAARSALWRGLRYQPGWIVNRGVLSMLLKCHLMPSG
jgi:glycosyltransferase involved in cell wall biosynthesis